MSHSLQRVMFGTEAYSAGVLANLLRGQLLFVPEWGWMGWDGTRWLPDVDGIWAQVLARRVLHKYYASRAERATSPQEQAEAHKAAERARSTQYITHVLEQLKGKLRASIIELDMPRFLVNCPNCVVDVVGLEDDIMRPHIPEYRLTNLSATRYVPDARSELWERFLEDVFLGDRELIAYMQRALGYSITGETQEQKLFICYGTGANGKSTLFEVVRGVMGDYVQDVPMWAMRRDETSRSAMLSRVDLHRARLVLISDIPVGRLSDKVLDNLFATGDTVTASYPHNEPFEFVLWAKLWLSTNSKPCITNRALLHRVVVIPFRAVFTNDPNVDPAVRRDPDPLIKEKLLQSPHREAILAWLVEGARAWYREGLKEPDIVRAATEECFCGPGSK